MEKPVRQKIKILLLAFGFAGAGTIWARRITRALEQAPSEAMASTYRRVDWWILSARCAQLRKVLLVVCGPQNKLYPIEDVSPMDDRGHGLLADMVALTQSRPFDKADIVRVNIWINAVGILLLALVFLLCGMPWAGFLSLMVGSCYGIPGPIMSADAQATFFGEYCLIILPIPWVVQLAYHRIARWRLIIAGSLSWAALTWALLLREAIGLIGIACTGLFVVIVFLYSKPKTWKIYCRYGFHLFFGILILMSNSIILSVRDRWLNLPPAYLIKSHGIAHAFHQGLGTEPNSWGIQYDDTNGAEAAIKINPQAIFGTPLYYVEMRRLYLDILRRYPLQVAAIYWRKFKKTLALPLQFAGISIMWYVLGVTCALPFLLQPSRSPSVSVIVILAMEVTLGVFLLQGVFIIPRPIFLYPAKFGTLLLLMGLADAGMDWVFDRKRRRSLDSASRERS